MSWLLQRFKTLTTKEIKEMLDLPTLKDTVAGRELWEEGLDKGKMEGKMETLLRQTTRKFGPLDHANLAALKSLSNAQMDALTEDILFLPNAEALEAWLRDH
jgi:predicted transposase YdaD